MNNKSKWEVYLILTKKGKVYTGISTNAIRRLHEHQATKKGAKYFRSDYPENIFIVKSGLDRSIASKLEYKLKQLSHKTKLTLIETIKTIPTHIDNLLDNL